MTKRLGGNTGAASRSTKKGVGPYSGEEGHAPVIHVGITGSSGFIGSHVVERFRRDERFRIVPFEKGYFLDEESLKRFVSSCDAVVHLAAMNRGNDEEILRTNVTLVEKLVSAMRAANVRPHVIFASSTQSGLKNSYGISKKRGSALLQSWAGEQNGALSVLTIPNVFGDGCKPFYNSVVATFCHQLARGDKPEIKVDRKLELLHVNNLSERIFRVALNRPDGIEKMRVKGDAKITVSELLETLTEFRDCYISRGTIPVPDSAFSLNLFNVLLSYFGYEDLRRVPEVRSDLRGDLFEIVKLSKGGQVFFSRTNPGFVRGNHYHTRKIERFCVISGDAVIRLRRLGMERVFEYRISREDPGFIEIPVYHAHSIENAGSEELLTLFWSSEPFDPNDPDTFFEEVLSK